MSGIHPKELDLVTEPAPEFMWIWHVFQQLTHARHYHEGYPQGINHQEIHAWSQLYDEKLSKMDLIVLRALDVCFINTRNELQREQNVV